MAFDSWWGWWYGWIENLRKFSASIHVKWLKCVCRGSMEGKKDWDDWMMLHAWQCCWQGGFTKGLWWINTLESHHLESDAVREDLKIQKRFISVLKKVLQYFCSGCLMPCVNITSVKMCVNLKRFNFLVHFKLAFLGKGSLAGFFLTLEAGQIFKKEWNPCKQIGKVVPYVHTF